MMFRFAGKRRFGKAKHGATGTGYGLTVGLIAIVALGAVTTGGSSVKSLFGEVGQTLTEVGEAPSLVISPTEPWNMDILADSVPAYSAPVEFTITNTGGGTIPALSIELQPPVSGPDQTDHFEIVSDECSGTELRALRSCTLSIRAVTDENGDYSAALVVQGGEHALGIVMYGEASGLAPATLSVDQPTVTGMDVAGPGSPATGTPVTLTFTNAGDIATGSLTTSNDNATNFVIANDTCNGSALQGGDSCTVQVTPQASSGGSISANVSVGDGSLSATSALSGDVTGFNIYAFSSHTFTNCGASGRLGPSLSACRSQYSTSGNWDENNSYFSMPQAGYQMWTVPESATYRIEVAGAGRSGTSLYGARLRADFPLTEGEFLLIVVGQTGTHQYSGNGGTFVAQGSNYTTATPLIIAGGSAGNYYTNSYSNATFLESYYSLDSATTTNGAGPTGQNGQGGGGAHGGGGGGFYSSGYTNGGSESYGRGFRQGAEGGYHNYAAGFGGGGDYHSGWNASGGGGGYSGGRGGYYSSNVALGGSSFVAGSGSNRVDIAIDRSTHGYVTITKQ